MPVMELNDIWKIYDMGEVKVNALSGLSFQVENGENVIIIGPSGSGKSTLLHILGCLDRATKGSMTIDGIAIETLKDRELAIIRNKKIGFIFQSFNLLPKLTALENVELPMIYAHVPGKERRKKAIELLTMVGLGDRLKHRPTQLSGGQQQRVAVARALVNDPAFLLADEPTGNLDTRSSEDVLSLFLELNRLGKTVVVVTHDMDMVKYGSRVIKILDGRIESNEVNGHGNIA